MLSDGVAQAPAPQLYTLFCYFSHFFADCSLCPLQKAATCARRAVSWHPRAPREHFPCKCYRHRKNIGLYPLQKYVLLRCPAVTWSLRFAVEHCLCGCYHHNENIGLCPLQKYVLLCTRAWIGPCVSLLNIASPSATIYKKWQPSTPCKSSFYLQKCAQKSAIDIQSMV